MTRGGSHNVLFGFEFLPKSGGESVAVPMDVSRLDEFAALVEDSRATERSEVRLSGCPEPIPLAEAERFIATFYGSDERRKAGRFQAGYG